MANSTGTQGGSHDQHVKAGQQSHKTGSGSSASKETGAKDASTKKDDHSSSPRGGTHDQHVKAGQQSHKNS